MRGYPFVVTRCSRYSSELIVVIKSRLIIDLNIRL